MREQQNKLIKKRCKGNFHQSSDFISGTARRLGLPRKGAP